MGGNILSTGIIGTDGLCRRAGVSWNRCGRTGMKERNGTGGKFTEVRGAQLHLQITNHPTFNAGNHHNKTTTILLCLGF